MIRSPHEANRGAAADAPRGAFTEIDGELFYRISRHDRMPPFLMTLAGDSDLWMFVASSGGLTAGRVGPDGALFPYETADRLMDGHHHTGPITLLRVKRGTGGETLWQPFPERAWGDESVKRNLYKNIFGTQLIFEAIHPGLGLSFRYRWALCDALGIVRTAVLENTGETPLRVELLDGLRNILPFGAPLALYQQSSCLVDAYKRTECDPRTGLAIYSLTSRITDRVEAAEVLRAATVHVRGLPGATVALSTGAIDAFLAGGSVAPETLVTGRRGHYLAAASLRLAPGASATWHIVADTGRDARQIGELSRRLLDGDDAAGDTEGRIRAAGASLRKIIAAADALQCTARAEESAHHCANVLFNTMRGGAFVRNHDIPASDLRDVIRERNRDTARRHESFLKSLPPLLSVADLERRAAAVGDPDLERLCREYLPLWFGRRHGDPSRPWNRFAIRTKNAAGERALGYEGNWRDIFQNWEALALGYPGFLPGMIARFVNASTMDGFNPYRVTRDGVDWEVPDSRDPWSHIGYWGDHQVVYLLRFIEMMRRVSPEGLGASLFREICSYTNVPYRLRSYAEMVRNPRETIDFDAALAARIDERVAALGTDGKLVLDAAGRVHHVSLFEKLLVTALARLSNHVPGGGIWMNTQRPEWNDANNALVGNGVSMVTLCHLRRYMECLADLAAGAGRSSVALSTEVADWYRGIAEAFAGHSPDAMSCPPGAPAEPGGEDDPDAKRRRFLDAVGGVYHEYRTRVYDGGMSGRVDVPVDGIVAFCRRVLEHLDATIRGARRDDGLYQAYSLLRFAPDGRSLSVEPLYEMLEGQVAVLSSGIMTPEEAADILAALFASRMYRADQGSFLLYPFRDLPGFLEKNRMAADAVLASPLLRSLVDSGDETLVVRESADVVRFAPDIGRAADVGLALDRIAERPNWAALVARDRQPVLDLFERVFRHDRWTGRSGTMYGYEGLGCIYWHMVAKLLLAVQEILLRAADSGATGEAFDTLAVYYYRIRAGLGFEKTPTEYGAFPTDPYSHTPGHAGAQQPGMTGQVKEEILTRFGELGVFVSRGIVRFRPVLLRDSEFAAGGDRFDYVDLEGEEQGIDLPPGGALAFTFAGVPVVYTRTGRGPSIRVTGTNGVSERPGDALTPVESASLLGRDGGITRIDVEVPRGSLLPSAGR